MYELVAPGVDDVWTVQVFPLLLLLTCTKHVAHLRQERHISKFRIFELLV